MDFEGARGETRLFACFCAQGEKKKHCQQHYGESAGQLDGTEHINNEIIHLLHGALWQRENYAQSDPANGIR